jgi:hypothetical protein
MSRQETFVHEFMLTIIYNRMVSKDSIHKNEIYREKEYNAYQLMRYALYEAGIELHMTFGLDIVEIRKMYYKLPRTPMNLDECEACSKYKKNIPKDKKRYLFNYDKWRASLIKGELDFLEFCKFTNVTAEANPHKYHIKVSDESWLTKDDINSIENLTYDETIVMSNIKDIYMVGDCPALLLYTN